jgi:hypothetical protein
MQTQKLEIEADSLATAREQIQAAGVEGWRLMDEQLAESEREGVVTGLGLSLEIATEDAMNKLPDRGEVTHTEIQEPIQSRSIELQAECEECAREAIAQ